MPDDDDQNGLYVMGETLSPEKNYFEVEILDSGASSGLNIGLVTAQHPLNEPPGFVADSVGVQTSDGK